MSAVERTIAELTRVFRDARDKRSAHEQSRAILASASADPALLTEIIANHLRKPNTLNRSNYPVVAMDISTNPHFVLVANAWIPVPGSRTDLSTKAIHHHGTMLLSTVNAFGPGYEHWVFTPPERIGDSLYRMRKLSSEQHKLHTVAFVDTWVPHCPIYPSSLTITFALWSSDRPMSWKDRLKRIPIVKENEVALRQVVNQLGLTSALELKTVENFDYCPVDGGFRNIKERIEFELGPNEDYVHSLFHLVQRTGNEALAPILEEHLDRDLTSPDKVKSLLADLKSGKAIEGRLSNGHFDVPFANFTTKDIERSALTR